MTLRLIKFHAFWRRDSNFRYFIQIVIGFYTLIYSLQSVMLFSLTTYITEKLLIQCNLIIYAPPICKNIVPSHGIHINSFFIPRNRGKVRFAYILSSLDPTSRVRYIYSYHRFVT